MRTDPTLASVLAAYTTPLLAADWRINPRGASPEAVKLCADSLGIPVAGEDKDDAGPVRRRGVQWVEHVRMAALYLVFGHMPFEPVFEVRDGRAVLAALPERMPNTIIDIKTNDDGTLRSIVQEGRPGQRVTPSGGVEIPAERLLWYVHAREGATWQGRSLLRPAYSNWLLKLDTLRTQAIGIARFSAGTPVAEPLPGTNMQPAQIAEAQRMVSAIRVGENGGAVPNGFKLRIVGVEGTLPDALSVLRYYDEQMARAALTSMLDLGSTANGSRALGSEFADVFERALNGIAQEMAGVATQLCERLVTYNFGDQAAVPAVEPGDVGASPATVANSITTLLGAGAINPDAGLEAFVRDAYNLPPRLEPVVAPTGQAGAVKGNCNAPTSDGHGLCTRGAGDGTTHPGTGRCYLHDNAGTAPAAPEPVAEPSQVAAAEGGADRNRGNAEQLRRAYVHGDLATIIRWGTDGDHARCVAIASRHMTVDQAHGYCQLREKEATGLYTSQHAARVRAAAAPERAYREPTPEELAAGVDPAEVDEQHDALIAAGVAAFTGIVAAWGAALSAGIVAALTGGGIAALAKLRIARTDKAQAAIRDLMVRAHMAGVEQVLTEATRAGADHGLTVANVGPPATDLGVEAQVLVEQAADAVAGAAGREALRISPDAGTDDEVQDVAEQVVETVTAGPSSPSSPQSPLVEQAVTRAMGGGRVMAMRKVIDATPELGWVVFHSALRDTATCEACEAHDGTEYPDLRAGRKDFPGGNYVACEGRRRCRCLLAMRPAAAPVSKAGAR